MKTLKEYIIDTNISTALTEASLLDEIEDTLKSGDEIEKEFIEAEKDWKKLINSKNAKKFVSNNVYRLHIKSPALAKCLCRDIKNFSIDNLPDDLEFVDIEFNLEDALWSTEHYISIQVSSMYMAYVKATQIKYDDGGNPSDILPVKTAVKIIRNNIANSKYIQDLETVKSEFMKHITFIRK